jgi:uncharacterized protein (DUF1015 family)
VPQFLPFPGIRYARGGSLDTVCAPPYDVVDPDERARLLDADPHNSVRLILPDSYEGAARRLHEWQADGLLVTDDAPSFSVYRMTFTADDGNERSTTGVIGALALDAASAAGSDAPRGRPRGEPQEVSGGDILPHERTLPKAKSDRLELLRATRANLDPIWGLSLAAGLSAALAVDGAPLATARDAEGVRHELFALTDPARLERIAAVIGDAAVVLADGHHRFETARAYATERADAGIIDPGARSIMAFVVELAPAQLRVQAIHRVLNGAAVDLRARLADLFDVTPLGPNVPEEVVALERAMHERGGLGLVDRDGLALLVPRAALAARVAAAWPEAVHDIDAARFDVGVVPAIDGADVSYRHDAATVAAFVAKGTADAAVLLRPVTVDQIRAAAMAGVRMPEKTTFFAPKPRTGMVFRSLDVS